MRRILTVLILIGILFIVAVALWALAVGGLAKVSGGQPAGNQALTSDTQGQAQKAGPAPSVRTSTVPTAATSSVKRGGATSSANASTDASEGQVVSAKLLAHGTDKATYNRGETATGFFDLENTGSTAIDAVTTAVTVSRSVPFLGKVSQSVDHTFEGLGIGPGETRRIEFSEEIPSEYKGISTAGDYTFDVAVSSGGVEIGDFAEHVKVA